MTTKIGTYKGAPTISLFVPGTITEKFPLTFGVSKAKLILDHIREIRAFVEQNETSKNGPQPLGPPLTDGGPGDNRTER